MSDLVHRPDRGNGHPRTSVDRRSSRPAPTLPIEVSSGEDVVELREIFGILRRNLLLIFAFALGGTGLAWVVSIMKEPAWRASAVIQVDDPAPHLSTQLAILDRGGTRSDPLLSTLEVLRSHTVLGEIVDREGLRLEPTNGQARRVALEAPDVGPFALPDTIELAFSAAGIRATSARLNSSVDVPYGAAVELGEVRFVIAEAPDGVSEAAFRLVPRDEAIRDIDRRLATRSRPQTNIVDVEYTAADPALAQRVTNRAVTVFRSKSMDEARRVSSRRRTFLEEQLAQADTALRTIQEELSSFRTRNQIFGSGERAIAQQTGLMGIEMRRGELRADRQILLQLLGSIESASANGEPIGNRLQALAASPEVAMNPVVTALFEQLLTYETEREALVSGPWGATPRNPDVARLDQQIATTTGRLESALGSQLDNLDARVAAMDDLRSRTAAQISGLPESEAEEARLMQQVASVQSTVEQLREEFFRARIAEAVEEGPVEVVDLARLPHEEEGAGLPLMLALGLILGILTGSGGAFLREALNNSVRRREDVEKDLQAPMVGVIPRLRAPARSRVLRNGSLGNGGGGNGNGSGKRNGTELIALHLKRTAQAEAFRTLRTNLLFAQERDPVRLLVVTSAHPGEGKTTTATNLAVTYAQQGLDVVLVDGDLRKPRVAEVFGLSRVPGVTEWTRDEADLSEVVRAVGEVPGLSILPSGTIPDAPSELIGGTRIREMLDLLRDRHEMVIVDSPPLAGGADAAILGAMCDGVLMVVRAGQTDREAVRTAARQLGSVGARLLGAVMNDPSGQVETYGYGYGYGYGYHEEEND